MPKQIPDVDVRIATFVTFERAHVILEACSARRSRAKPIPSRPNAPPTNCYFGRPLTGAVCTWRKL
jgi:hypothetical protein